MAINDDDLEYIERHVKDWMRSSGSGGDPERNTAVNLAILQELKALRESFETVADRLERIESHLDPEIKKKKSGLKLGT